MKKVISMITLIALSACEQQQWAKNQAEKFVKPEISEVGVFDHCAVKYVDRGAAINSFYIAKCDTTTTTTVNWEQREGKHTESERTVLISSEIAKLTAEKDRLDKIAVAMAKLTPEERKILSGK